MNFATTLDRLLAGEDMTRAEAYDVMDSVLAGGTSPERLTALLVALRTKPTCVDELVGFASAMRGRGQQIRAPAGTLDNCGTGGAATKTFNISTAASFVIAAAGVPVAKHGNRSVTRPSGSADLLERAGARLDLSPTQCQRVLDATGITFLFAPTFHPAMRHVAPVRKELGIKTVFNLLGPLTNPAGVRTQVLGVYDPDLVPLMASALAGLGCQDGFVLHGHGGTDEATPCGPVVLAPIRGGAALPARRIDPTELGLARCTAEALAPVPAEDGPALLEAILTGRDTGPRADAVALNAAFGLVAAKRAPDLAAGLEMARSILGAGSGMAKCKAFIETTRSHDG